MRNNICFIVPPHIYHSIGKTGTEEQQSHAQQMLAHSTFMRGVRHATSVHLLAEDEAIQPVAKMRKVYSCHNLSLLPGIRMRREGHAPSRDTQTNQAYDGAGATWDLYHDVFGRNSIDDKGLPLISSVHYRRRYDNAFWNGQQMVYGDGDGQFFNPFTGIVDVIGHELTHGVTQYTANLDYQDQPGALNESISDCFGSMVKQFLLKQDVAQADWLIGQGIFTNKVNGVALRSMKDPGTAYDDPVLGKDPQPATMADYVNTQDDNGGVHLNSGIPNRAFYLAAQAIGGYSWEVTGKIWYTALTTLAHSSTNFADFARMTIQVAEHYDKVPEVTNAWHQVEVI